MIKIIAVHVDDVWYTLDGVLHKSWIHEDQTGTWYFIAENGKTIDLMSAITRQGGMRTLQQYDSKIHK
jgi:hypothetical protein